jgi:hypothetical protein
MLEYQKNSLCKGFHQNLMLLLKKKKLIIKSTSTDQVLFVFEGLHGMSTHYYPLARNCHQRWLNTDR